MKTIKLKIGILALSLLAGCQVGPMIHEIDELKSPFGANVRIEVSQTGTSKTRKYDGELIETRDDGLVVALRTEGGAPSRVTFAPWSRIHLVKATELPGFQARGTGSQSPESASTEKMRIISRFPQGLSPELMEQLLVGYDQATIDSLP